jgi:hypothetical protein
MRERIAKGVIILPVSRPSRASQPGGFQLRERSIRRYIGRHRLCGAFAFANLHLEFAFDAKVAV